ncbi:phosphate ABC transporter permease subunit PstC [Candidatus Aerophobetes bacterium]|nr:phosphate ABC transporter permease subunit PstC [Candidatus Aerophobetes bacterium]
MKRTEKVFKSILYFCALVVVVLVGAIFLSLLVNSLPSIKKLGASFLLSTTWDPVTQKFGSLPFLVGTLITSFIALLICIPFSLCISLFLGEYFTSGIFSSFLKSAVEILAGIPSVIYGLWGLFVLVPIIREVQIKIGTVPYGVGIFTASLILAVMIIPYSASVGREVIQLVPSEIKEAALSLGATRFEVIRKVILPYARSGIIAGILLSLGRALGETMAVTMVIGNANTIPTSIFAPSNTMASLIANEFIEATERLHLSSLIEIGLLLFLVTTIISALGRYIIKKINPEA